MKRKCYRKLWRRTTTSARWQRRSSIRRWRPTKRTAQQLWQQWMRNSRRKSVSWVDDKWYTYTFLPPELNRFFFFSFYPIGQEVGGGAEEQRDQRAGRRHLGRLKVTKGGLYRVFYVSKDWFIFCSASIFVVFTTHLFEIRNTSSTLWIFQFSCYKCTCAGFTCVSFPSLLRLIHLICSLSVQLQPFLEISSVYLSFLRKHVSMHRSFVPAYFIVHFGNVSVNCTCFQHLLYLRKNKKKRNKEVAQGIIQVSAVTRAGV